MHRDSGSSASKRTSPRLIWESSWGSITPHIGRYERGGSRPSADTLRRRADALGVTADYLIEGAAEEVARARIEDRELVRMFEEVERLTEEDRVVVKKLLDAFLMKKHIQVLAAR